MTTAAATTTATYPPAVDSRHISAYGVPIPDSAGAGVGVGGIGGGGGGGYNQNQNINGVTAGHENLKGTAYAYNYTNVDRHEHQQQLQLQQLQQQQQQHHHLYPVPVPAFGDTFDTTVTHHQRRPGSGSGSVTKVPPSFVRSSSSSYAPAPVPDYPMENSNPAFDAAVGSRPGTATATVTPMNDGATGTGAGAEGFHAQSPSSPYEHAQQATTSTAMATASSGTAATTTTGPDANDRQQRRYMHAQTPSSSYLRESFRQSKDDSGIFTDVRSAADTPVDVVSEAGGTPAAAALAVASPVKRHFQNVNVNINGTGTGMPKHPSISPNGPGNVPPPPRHSPIVPSSAGPSYKPSSIPISSSTRAVAQQPTYITPPSSPTPIAVNPVYTYATDTTPRYPAQQQSYRPSGYPTPPEGREICVECAMRDQDMADVDVLSPGVWERESDILYHELCRQEMEEAEERARARASNSSSESQQVVLRPLDHNRPRARGNRLTEPNLKLWNSMNPKEANARQQGIELYVKTQTALLEAEALARARALQESRLLESKLKDTYNHLRQSTYDVSPGATAVDENGLRLKPSSHSQKRSLSGPTSITLGPIVVDAVANHGRPSQSREVTLLENGMIVEQVDVRKEERERRREEKRERSRARKSSRGSGGDRNGEVMSMYSAPSPLPYQTDSGFYTAASNGSGPVFARDRDRPMSLSQSSTRAMSVLTTPQPLTPPPGSAPGSARPPNTRVHSQISLVDSQSISSASMSANRRSKFFAFRNWSEAWKSRDSFAPSGVMSLSGSMMDMHLALDQERQQQAMHTRPTTVDLGSNAPSIRHSQIFPRRASVSVDRDVPSRGIDRPKKKKGLAKIWGLVRGNRSSSKNEVMQQKRDVTQLVNDRSEDDTPLAPPPPLSYLVNRTPRERSMSNASRRTSVPSGVAAPPPTATLPTPTSIRNTWLDDCSSSRQVGGMLPAHTEESHSNANGYGSPETDVTRQNQSGPPMNGELDMRQRMQESVSTPGPVIHTPGSPRPISVYSLHKSLPPLPNEAPASQSSMPTPVSDSPRPVTMFDMNTNMHMNGQNGYDYNSANSNNNNNDMLGSPQPYFRQDVRRQSFGGTTSRPDLTASGTFPLSGRTNPRPALGGPQDPFGYSPYNELGAMPVTSRSAGKLALGFPTDDNARCDGDKAIGKRRSKFGLSNLLGKMTGSASRTSFAPNTNINMTEARLSLAVPPMHVTPPAGPPTSESDTHQDGSPSVTEYGAGGNGSSRSRHNGNGYAVNPGVPSRMSIASRRAIEELVDQDPKFVAYRYPSVDQNIALLR